MYQVVVERQAERDLRRLPASLLHRALLSLQALTSAPRPPGCRKLVSSQNDWRIRVGDYRVIYGIDDRQKVVRVMRVRHRREAYR